MKVEKLPLYKRGKLKIRCKKCFTTLTPVFAVDTCNCKAVQYKATRWGYTQSVDIFFNDQKGTFEEVVEVYVLGEMYHAPQINQM